MSGLLTDPACDGSMQALHDCASENHWHANTTCPERIRKEYSWATRDLNRLQSDGTWGSRY
jgi:hypothetical protein